MPVPQGRTEMDMSLEGFSPADYYQRLNTGDEVPGLLTPNRQAVLGMAAGLLNAGGWKPVPPSFGSVVGTGLQSGLDNYRDAITAAAKMAAANNKELPGDVQKYLFAVRQGYKGSYTEF